MAFFFMHWFICQYLCSSLVRLHFCQPSMARMPGNLFVTQALVILLLGLIRGRDGVCFVSVVFSERMQMLERDLPGIVRVLLQEHEEQSEYEEEDTWASHIEGRHTGHSGMHPIRALRKLSIRKSLLEVAQYWSTFLAGMHAGATLTPDVLTDMADAVLRNVALRVGVMAGRYTQQQVCKYLSYMLPDLYGCRPAEYTQDFHEYLSKRQAGHGDLAQRMGFADASVFNAWVRTLSVPQWIDSDRDGITWASAWVHLCEVRQVLQRYTVAGVMQLLQAPGRNYKGIQRDEYYRLCEDARRGSCFAVAMVGAVAAALGMEIEREKAVKKVRISKARLTYIAAALARRGLSPKVCIAGIPEWHAARTGVRLCIASLRGQSVLSRRTTTRIRSNMTFIKLQRKAAKFGIQPRPRESSGVQRNRPKHELMRMLLAKGVSLL